MYCFILYQSNPVASFETSERYQLSRFAVQEGWHIFMSPNCSWTTLHTHTFQTGWVERETKVCWIVVGLVGLRALQSQDAYLFQLQVTSWSNMCDKWECQTAEWWEGTDSSLGLFFSPSTFGVLLFDGWTKRTVVPTSVLMQARINPTSLCVCSVLVWAHYLYVAAALPRQHAFFSVNNQTELAVTAITLRKTRSLFVII